MQVSAVYAQPSNESVDRKRDSNNMYHMMPPLNDSSSSSFEYSLDYPPLTSTPCNVLKKPRQKHQSKDKSNHQRPQYPDDVPGPINLDLIAMVGDVNSVCTYSKKLKRIYTMTNQALPIRFTWSPAYQPLYLRSALVFADEYHRTTPVQRCYVHQGAELPQNAGISFDQLRHVFRVSDPGNIYETIYETDANKILSTRTTLNPGEGEIWLDFKFFCQNSCATGISRRATKLIFLVEDAMGNVVAQRSVLIQICSNPKRDKERDETRLSSDSKRSKKKIQPQPPLPPNNSQNSFEEDGTVYALNVEVMGKENYKKVLQFAYDLMASQAVRTGNYQLYKPHMDAILMKEMEEDL